MSKRSREKRITTATKALRYMRQSSGLSLCEAGKICDLSGSAIAHMEHGRMDVPKSRIKALVKAYGFTMEEYNAYVNEKEIPVNYRDECIAFIRVMDVQKIKMIHGLLEIVLDLPSFSGQ